MADFSKQLFSLNKAVPDYLPSRFRLKNKQTRTPYSVELSDLSLLGYEGPIEVPTYDNANEELLWDPDHIRYVVVPKNSDKPCHIQDRKTRTVIKERITHYKLLINEYITQEYSDAIHEYLTQLNFLLLSDSCLVLTDVPELNFSGICYTKDGDELVLAWLNATENIAKIWYEKFLFIPNFPAELINCFKLPPTWVPDLDESVVFTIKEDNTSKSNHLVSVSGYNTVTKDSSYSLTPERTVDLNLISVYFPHG